MVSRRFSYSQLETEYWLMLRCLPLRRLAMTRREVAAKGDPAHHRRKNEPRLRVNDRVDSHDDLHGRP